MLDRRPLQLANNPRVVKAGGIGDGTGGCGCSSPAAATRTPGTATTPTVATITPAGCTDDIDTNLPNPNPGPAPAIAVDGLHGAEFKPTFLDRMVDLLHATAVTLVLDGADGAASGTCCIERECRCGC